MSKFKLGDSVIVRYPLEAARRGAVVAVIVENRVERSHLLAGGPFFSTVAKGLPEYVVRLCEPPHGERRCCEDWLTLDVEAMLLAIVGEDDDEQ